MVTAVGMVVLMTMVVVTVVVVELVCLSGHQSSCSLDRCLNAAATCAYLALSSFLARRGRVQRGATGEARLQRVGRVARGASSRTRSRACSRMTPAATHESILKSE